MFVMGEMHNEDPEMNETNIRETTARFQGARLLLRNVIRSLREDVHVSRNSEHHVRMVAQLRREGMVAHDFASTSFLGPL